MILVGTSVRAAASSAQRAGLQPWAIDCFADRDLRRFAHTTRLRGDETSQDFVKLLAIAPDAPWIYTGAWENQPTLIDQLADVRPLWGNLSAALAEVRDPIRLAALLRDHGLPAVDVRASPTGLPIDGTYLRKPIGSGGGVGIAPWRAQADAPSAPCCYQKHIVGDPLSASFVAVAASARLLGVTSQLLGRPGADFAYAGSVGPITLQPAPTSLLVRIGHALASAAGLRGLFGIDFVLDAAGTPWPIEVNPRYTASMEVLELSLSRSFLLDHRMAFQPNPGVAPSSNPPSAQRCWGKRILYAPFPLDFPLESTRLDRLGLHAADLPDPGTPFQPGEPILTILTSSRSVHGCVRRLDRKAAVLMSTLGKTDDMPNQSFPSLKRNH